MIVPTIAVMWLCELKQSGNSLMTRRHSAAPAMVKVGRLKRREAMAMMETAVFPRRVMLKTGGGGDCRNGILVGGQMDKIGNSGLF